MAKRIVVGLIALLCVVLVMGAVGCGSKKGNPEQTVNDFWSAVQSGNYTQAKTYFASSVTTSSLDEITAATDPITAELAKSLMGLITMKTTGSTIDGDSATVNVTVTMPDMDVAGEAITQVMTESMGSDPANANLEEAMKQLVDKLPAILKDAPTKTETSQVQLVWENNAWKIKADPLASLSDNP